MPPLKYLYSKPVAVNERVSAVECRLLYVAEFYTDNVGVSQSVTLTFYLLSGEQ